MWYLCLFIKTFYASELQITNDKEKNDWRNQCLNMFLREVHIAKYHYIVDKNIMTNDGHYLFELDTNQISECERARNMMINY